MIKLLKSVSPLQAQQRQMHLCPQTPQEPLCVAALDFVCVNDVLSVQNSSLVGRSSPSARTWQRAWASSRDRENNSFGPGRLCIAVPSLSVFLDVNLSTSCPRNILRFSNTPGRILDQLAQRTPYIAASS